MKRLVTQMAFLVLVIGSIVGCRPEFTDGECSTEQDCFPGESCINGECVLGTNPNNVNNTNNVNDMENDQSTDMGNNNNNNDMGEAVASVVVTPPESTIDLAETVLLSGQPKNATGMNLDRPVTWSTSDPTIATVDAAGEVTGVSEGVVTITATSEGIDGTATVTVEKKPVATVVITPDMTALGLGNTVQLAVTVADAQGNELFGRDIIFTSNDTNVVTVMSDGVVTARGVGMATISATVETVLGTSEITVVPDPVDRVEVTPSTVQVEVVETFQLTGQTFDANNQELLNRAVTWTSSDDAIATVSATGVVTGVAAGTATITGTSEGKMDDAVVTVVPRPVATVVVTPATADVVAGGTQQLSAQTRAADNTDLMRPVTWTTSDMAIATVDTNGLVTTVAEGSATITATSEGIMGTAVITVLPTVASVDVTPATATLDPTDTTTLSATPRDSGGNALSGRDAAVWTSNMTSVATVDSSGVVTAVGAGTATITATIEGVAGNAVITVREPVASVVVTPTGQTIVQGSVQPMMASPRDSSNMVLTGRGTPTWMSSNTSIAIVNTSGIVTGVGPGTATITATIEGVSGNTTIDVLAAIASVDVSGSAAGADIGQMVTFTATPRDSGGNALTGRSCSFTSGNTSVATINPTTGVATITGEGDTTISATCETTVGTAALGGYGPVATVTVAPQGVTLTHPATQQYTATLQDSTGHTLTGRTVVWTSGTMAAATVSGTGLASTVAAGSSMITATSEGQTGTSTLTVQ